MRIGQKADIILHGKNIFTGCGNTLVEGFIAIKDNKIIDVNGTEGMDIFISSETKVFDCGDQLIMPGFHDAHTHLFLAMLFMDAVNLYTSKSEQDAAQMVADYAAKQKDDGSFVMGYDWNSSLWSDQYPTKESLDKLIPNKPVFLLKLEGHGGWLNSKALELLNINKETEPMEGGAIFKDDEGNPTGYIGEKALAVVYGGITNILFSTAKVAEEKSRNFFQVLSMFGITSVSDMYVSYKPVLAALENLENRDELDLRFNFAIVSVPENTDEDEINENKKYQSDKLRFQGVKFLYDGVALGYTADLLEPYTDCPETTNLIPMDYENFKDEVLKYDAEGYRVRIHCIGDKAVRDALNMFEECQKINGVRDSRHSIAHIEVLHPDDVKRFKELGVIADIHPAHITLASEKAEDNSYVTRLGSREKMCFNYKTLLDHGARIAMGSDVPVVTPNPMLGIYRAVTRRFDDGLPVDGWIPEQRLPIVEVLKFYTQGSAYHDFMESKIGTIETGKLADLVVIGCNLLEVDVEQIRDAAVVMTICDGKIVYQKNEQ